jgi:hypothetical protein
MIGSLNIKTVDGYWLDDDDTVYTVNVCIGSWNSEENDLDYKIFYYTDGEPIEIGTVIAGDFVITNIH